MHPLSYCRRSQAPAGDISDFRTRHDLLQQNRPLQALARRLGRFRGLQVHVSPRIKSIPCRYGRLPKVRGTFVELPYIQRRTYVSVNCAAEDKRKAETVAIRIIRTHAPCGNLVHLIPDFLLCNSAERRIEWLYTVRSVVSLASNAYTATKGSTLSRRVWREQNMATRRNISRQILGLSLYCEYRSSLINAKCDLRSSLLSATSTRQRSSHFQ